MVVDGASQAVIISGESGAGNPLNSTTIHPTNPNINIANILILHLHHLHSLPLYR